MVVHPNWNTKYSCRGISRVNYSAELCFAVLYTVMCSTLHSSVQYFTQFCAVYCRAGQFSRVWFSAVCVSVSHTEGEAALSQTLDSGQWTVTVDSGHCTKLYCLVMPCTVDSLHECTLLYCHVLFYTVNSLLNWNVMYCLVWWTAYNSVLHCSVLYSDTVVSYTVTL